MKSFYIVTVLLMGVTAIAEAQQKKSPAALMYEVRDAIGQLNLAVEQSGATGEPISAVDQMEKWQELISQAGLIKEALGTASENTDAVIQSLKLKAENYSADKAAVLNDRISKLQEQSDSLFALGSEIDGVVAKLQQSIDRIKSDPEVKSYLESKKLAEETDVAITNAMNAIPDFMK